MLQKLHYNTFRFPHKVDHSFGFILCDLRFDFCRFLHCIHSWNYDESTGSLFSLSFSFMEWLNHCGWFQDIVTSFRSSMFAKMSSVSTIFYPLFPCHLIKYNYECRSDSTLPSWCLFEVSRLIKKSLKLVKSEFWFFRWTMVNSWVKGLAIYDKKKWYISPSIGIGNQPTYD